MGRKKKILNEHETFMRLVRYECAGFQGKDLYCIYKEKPCLIFESKPCQYFEEGVKPHLQYEKIRKEKEEAYKQKKRESRGNIVHDQ